MQELMELVVWAVIILVCAACLKVCGGYQCAARWQQSGRESDYGWMAGCLVSDGSGMVPDNRIRVVE